MGRTCEGCGLKMHPFSPRKRIDGKLICRNCIEGRPGRPRAQAVLSVHSCPVDGGALVYSSGTSQFLCPLCGRTWPVGVFAGLQTTAEREAAEKPCDHFEPDPEDGPSVCKNCSWAIGAHSANAGGPTGHGYDDFYKHAHDSGDGARVYHCPMCGGGQVTGRSDGTIECEFCKTCFTVQVQPEFAAMPQTIDGAPVDIPGMPGSPGGAPEGDQAAPGAPVSVPQPPGGAQDAFVPPGAQVPPQGAPAPGGAFVPPQKKAAARTRLTTGLCTKCNTRQQVTVASDDDRPPCKRPGCDGVIVPAPRKQSLYVGPEGVAMPEESYVRHLALRFADDRDAVLEDIREANAR